MLLPLARLALRRPLPVLAVFAVTTAAAVAGLLRLELRTDGAAIYPQGNPVVERSRRDAETFQEPEWVIVLVTARPGGPPVESPEGFRFLDRSHAEIRRLPAVDPNGVRSLVNLLEPPADPDEVRIRDYFETWDRSDAGFPALRERIRKMPLTHGLYLARDGRSAALYLAVPKGGDRRALIDSVESWIAARSRSPFELRITGPAAAEAELGDEVLRDLARLVPVMVAVVALLLWISLRTPGGVLIPLAQVSATLLWTLGLMGWTGAPVTLVTTILPVLLMAMSMTDEIHLLERLQDRLATAPGAGRERLRAAAAAAFADLQSPLVLTSLTTAAGFLSFGTASMVPLRQFGLFCCIGLLLAMLSTFSLVPALISVLPPGWTERGVRSQSATSSPGVLRRPRAMALAGLACLALAVPGLLRLRIQDSWVDNFDPRSPLVTAERELNASFWGSYRFDIVLEADSLYYFWTPAGLRLLEEVHRVAESAPHTGGVLDVLLPYGTAAGIFGHAPPLSALPEKETRRIGLLVEALTKRIDLRHYLGLRASQARVRLFVRGADFARGDELRAYLEARLPRLTAGRPVRAHLSGDVPVGLEVVRAIVGNQMRSIGWTAVQIAALLLVVSHSPRRTLLVMAPVAAATLLLFGGLGYLGLPLGIATSMFAALTMGAGVDFALHFTHAYDREKSAGLSHEEALRATHRTAGRGLRWNALVLALGFSVLALSAIKPNASLGLLLAAAMLVSWISTLVFLPELLRRAPSPRPLF